jgi:hypothetical protein
VVHQFHDADLALDLRPESESRKQAPHWAKQLVGARRVGRTHRKA